MDDDDYGADEALLAAMAASDPVAQAGTGTSKGKDKIQQPAPQKLQQPTPQRLDRPPPATSRAGSGSGSGIVQPTPQALPPKHVGGSTILVSPRQRGNPVLTSIRSVPWEYSDIPADYVLGLTTCALFLRLHPEYIYTRIRNLQGRYDLRILLTMVDIPNHEDSLRELSKTSLVNNVTIILCWSAAEAGRYLELYKSYENAGFAAIRGQQASSYADRLVEFVTVPRSLNKSDAVALVASFGSLKNAINAEQEQLGMISGWGGIKVKRWSAAIEEPFRAKKAAKRGLGLQASGRGRDGAGSSQHHHHHHQQQDAQRVSRLEQAVPLSRVPLRDMPARNNASSRASPTKDTPSTATDAPKQFHFLADDEEHEADGDDDIDAEDALLAAAIEESKKTGEQQQQQQQQQQQRGHEASGLASAPDDDGLSGGVAAALARLRENG
ncbi:hypothetical protein E4U43_000534 [Claviceps pusilla]|uniref:ERCC1-like central domain-containing protein n=1 Tax=Claviceps pusilla TaxID=123648 RepID=A0A9P7N9U7_9HYPO|nr:hypothetical protein E4U43_000534 [Claviceps pusilla]